MFHKFRQKLANSDVTKEAMNPLLAADSLVDAISFIRRIVLWSENRFSSNPVPEPAGFEFLNLATSSSSLIWNSQYNPNLNSLLNTVERVVDILTTQILTSIFECFQILRSDHLQQRCLYEAWSQWDQQRFTVFELAADWHELMIPQRIWRPSIAPSNEQLDPRCSMETHHSHNQPHYSVHP